MLEQAQEARLQKALNKLFNFDGKVMTLREFFSSKHLVRASAQTRNHETHRRELEYKPLSNSVTEYTIWYTEGERELGIDVPKVVYEFYALPRTERTVY